MTPERWQQVRAIYEEVASRPAVERRAYLDDACLTDSRLRSEVESLLAADDSAFLAEPPLGAVAVEADRQRIGPYRVVRPLGRGGMGSVFLAEREQDDFSRQVAIKVVRPEMETAAALLRRFRAERQILAGLDHPGIARLYDGGSTEDGLPYFVMEHVEGEHLLAHCDQRRLTVRERVALFLRVCEAVQHAHQNLVVHRDLKPSNVLVTAQGEPKLLDFGIAKLLQPLPVGDEEAATATLLRAMTPEYASPEQVRGERITPASDVYSLGVILYELLAGRRPYRLEARTPGALEAAICHQEAERPSAAVRGERGDSAASAGSNGDGGSAEPGDAATRVAAARGVSSTAQLRRLLRGDLDNVVLKALRKDPRGRYATAAELAEDLRRYLDGRPVEARPASVAYRSAKFVRRHRWSLAAASLAVAALLAGLALAIWQARVAQSERRRAERRFADVRRLANSVLFEMHDGIARLPGSTAVRALLVQRAMLYLDSLAGEVQGDPALQRELAAAYEKVGDVQSDPWGDNLGDSAGGLRNFRRAESIRQALAAAAPEDVEVRTELLSTRRKIGALLALAARDLESRDVFRQALAADAAGLPPARDPAQRLIAARHLLFRARVLRALAELEQTYDLKPALAVYGTAREELRGMLREGSHPQPARVRLLLAEVVSDVGHAVTLFGQREAGLVNLREAVALRQELLATDASNASLRLDLLSDQVALGRLLRRLRDFDGARATLEAAVLQAGALVDLDPVNTRTRRLRAQAQLELGHVRMDVAAFPDALSSYGEAAAALEELVATDSANVSYSAYLGAAYRGIGQVATRLAHQSGVSPSGSRAHWQEARRAFQRSMELRGRSRLPVQHVAPEDDELAVGLRNAEAALARLQG